MSRNAHIPSHRKPRARSRKNLALRAGVAGGLLSTIAVTTAASSASATGTQPDGTQAGAPEAPETLENTAQLPTLSAGLSSHAERTADSLQMSALQYELDEARDNAAQEAADIAEEKKEKAEAKAKAEAEAARKAEEARAEAAQERSSRSADRTTLSTTASGSVAQLLGFLQAQVGKSYVMGASGPSSYDCSGLTQAAFRQIGVDLPRTSQAQSTTGTQVPVSQVQPGDLLFWGGAGSAYHVAVYVGNGSYIDAANPSKGVVQQNMSDWAPTSATRVL